MLEFTCKECGRILRDANADCPQCSLYDSGATVERRKVDQKVRELMKDSKQPDSDNTNS